MDDPNRRERRIDGRSGFLVLKDDPDLITEDDLANPWILASQFRPTGEYLRWLMEHGFLQSLVTCGNPNCDLSCTLQLSLTFKKINKIITMKIRVSNMVYWHFW